MLFKLDFLNLPSAYVSCVVTFLLIICSFQVVWKQQHRNSVIGGIDQLPISHIEHSHTHIACLRWITVS